MSKAGMGLEFSCGENPSLVPAVATPYGSSGLNPDQYVDHMEKALQGERPRHVTKPRARPVGISEATRDAANDANRPPIPRMTRREWDPI